MDKEIKAYIFDLDGVLVFTDELHYLAWKKIADKLNIEFDRKINNRLRGVSRMDSLEIILEKSAKRYSEEQKKALAEEKNEYYRESLETMTPDDVVGKVREKLTELRNAGCKLAIGSSSKNTKLILNKIGMTDFFDAISDGTNITKSKPDPEVFLKAAEMLGIDPQYCAVVEDAESGIDAAKAAGMYAIGIGEAANYHKTDRPISSIMEI
ncbi:MAG: beta-phosphoglucomutase [Butyrivibrio sp.]|nr:beta-phosphoglucomutase [Butyrivibrio sp.]